MASTDSPSVPSNQTSSLEIYDASEPRAFQSPVKKINDGQDVQTFLTSQAYTDIGTFIMQLNIAVCPRKSTTDGKENITSWTLDSSDQNDPEQVVQLQQLLQAVEHIIDEVPPAEGPRRFGNISYRKWYEVLQSQVTELLKAHLSRPVLEFAYSTDGDTPLDELTAYFLGSFGSAQRLDYGTGHELSFLAFLGSIWKLGGFGSPGPDGAVERSIVFGVIEPYLRVIRRLILTYTLEPAGSHGVWGLDDHSFLPYIFGSAQYCPAISEGDSMPVEGSLRGAPKPADVVKKNIVDELRPSNMYFSAIGFINDVKTGPFWEHSPILFDISGIRQGWGKINKGMIKMYHAEVLSKFPVVQHFPFGSFFKWERDPKAADSPLSVHTASQPNRGDNVGTSTGITGARMPETTKAPWASSGPGAKSISRSEGTAAPWARPTNVHPPSDSGMPMTAAPWASARINVVDPADFVPSRAPIPRGTPGNPSSMRPGPINENR